MCTIIMSFLPVIYLCLIPGFAFVVDYNYDYCLISRKHTMCLHKDEIPSPRCGKGATLTYASAYIKQYCLDLHNDLRSDIALGYQDVNSLPEGADILELEWDDELEIIAQRHVMQCTRGHDAVRNVDRFHVAQNIHRQYTTGSSYPDPISVYTRGIMVWADQLEKFSESRVSIESYEHYEDNGTYISAFCQMIWHTTKYIGCAIQNFESNDQKFTHLVCNYGPGGNIKGEPVYKEGKKCTDCPSTDSNCSYEYEGLCSYYIDDDYVPVILSSSTHRTRPPKRYRKKYHAFTKGDKFSIKYMNESIAEGGDFNNDDIEIWQASTGRRLSNNFVLILQFALIFKLLKLKL